MLERYDNFKGEKVCLRTFTNRLNAWMDFCNAILRKNRSVSQSKITAIWEMARNGLEYTDIALRLSMDYKTVWSVAKRKLLICRKRRNPVRKFLEENPSVTFKEARDVFYYLPSWKVLKPYRQLNPWFKTVKIRPICRKIIRSDIDFFLPKQKRKFWCRFHLKDEFLRTNPDKKNKIKRCLQAGTEIAAKYKSHWTF